MTMLQKLIMFIWCLAPGVSCDDHCDANFSECKDVLEAYCMLIKELFREVKKFSNEDFELAKTVCCMKAHKALHAQIKSAKNFYKLISVITENEVHCNWLNVSLLKILMSVHNRFKSLFDNYENAIFSKTLQDVWSAFPCHAVRNKYYARLKIILKKKPSSLTLWELHKHKPRFVETIAVDIQKGSVIVTWLVPSSSVYQAYLSMLSTSHYEDFIEIGMWKVYLPDCVLQEQRKLYG